MKQPKKKSERNLDDEIRKLLERNKNQTGALKKILRSLGVPHEETNSSKNKEEEK